MSTDNNTDIPQNAVSLYQQQNGAMDDFPILKAFQQYIDAEQNKARKRMVSLCIFFGILITTLVAVFVIMLRDIGIRNQQLNDRLVEYALKERDRQPMYAPPAPVQVPVAEPPTAVTAEQESAMRAITDTLVALQKQISDQQSQAQTATAVPPPVQPAMTPEEEAIAQRTQEAHEKLRRARALLEAEKKKLAEEREKTRLEEVERHRRKLYPEYYNKQEPAAPASSVPQQTSPNKRQLNDDDIADILREAYSSNDNEVDDDAGNGEEADADEDIEDAIEYFKDDEYQIPVEIKGTSTKWHVPID